MRRLIIALALTALALTSRADCTGNNLSINPHNKKLNAAFGGDAPNLKAGDLVTISIGSTELSTTVATVDASLPGVTSVELEKPTGAEFRDGTLVLDTELATEQADLHYKDTEGQDQVEKLCLVGHFSTSSQSIHLGPTIGDEEGESGVAPTADDGPGDDDANHPSAIRLQYERSFRRFVATNSGTGKIPSMRLMQQEFAVSIDTTNEKSDAFVDDNRVRAGFFTPRKTFGNALNRVRLGISGQHARAFHGSDNNSDITLTLDGGIPLFQAANVATPVRRLASPLSFRLSAGRRWADVKDVNSSGDLAEWSLLYHVYLLSSYRIDLEHHTVFSDMDNATAATPRTQHSWKATILFLGEEDSRFSAIASYEDGHSGPVFTKLRQFFVGVGLKNVLGSIRPN